MFDFLTKTVPPEIAAQGPQDTSVVGVGTRFANLAIIVGFSLAAMGMAYAFVLYVTSQGDPKSVQRAQRALFWSILAAVVSAAAWGIKTVVFNLFGVSHLP